MKRSISCELGPISWLYVELTKYLQSPKWLFKNSCTRTGQTYLIHRSFANQEGSTICSLLLTPSLIACFKLLSYDPSQGSPVSQFHLSILPEANPSINCFQALDYFQTGRAHLLLLSTTPGVAGGAIGVVTLEGTRLSFVAFGNGMS